jgi:uncharacterized protein
MRLPGETDEEFVLIQPYLARERPNMVAWLAGRSDGENLGELFAVQFPSSQTILGPMQAQARIEQDDDISAYITLRSREGSDVIRGNLQVLPIADSILYVEPLFLENPQARIPELARVALVMGERTAFDRTLAGALGQLLGIPVPEAIAEDEAVDVDQPRRPDADPDEEAEEPEEEEELTVSQELLRDALAAFAAAEEALRDGDLATYQEQIAIAQDLIQQAADEDGGTVEDLVADEDDDEPPTRSWSRRPPSTTTEQSTRTTTARPDPGAGRRVGAASAQPGADLGDDLVQRLPPGAAHPGGVDVAVGRAEVLRVADLDPGIAQCSA